MIGVGKVLSRDVPREGQPPVLEKEEGKDKEGRRGKGWRGEEREGVEREGVERGVEGEEG